MNFQHQKYHNYQNKKDSVPLPQLNLDDENSIKKFISEEAQEFSKSLKNTTSTQLRKFYNEVKALDYKIQDEKNYEDNELQILMLKPKLEYARNRPSSKIDKEFADFICNCINQITKDTHKTKFEKFKNFVKCFEAIVGFFPKRN